MNANVNVQIAEKLREAGVLLHEAYKLYSEMPAANGSAASIVDRAERDVSFIWGHFAAQAGREYLDWVTAGCPPTAEFEAGKIMGMVMRVPRADFVRLIEDKEFVYRGSIQIMLQLRDWLDGKEAKRDV